MSDQDRFERILVSLHDAMLDDTLWPATSALIDEACGTVGNALLIRDGLGDDGRVIHAGLYFRGERREDWEREYLDVYYPINECVPRFRQLPDSRVVHTPALYTPQELKTSPTYNEALRRGHAQYGLNVRLDGAEDFHIAWHLHDPVVPGGWESAQLRLVQSLLPHIRQFVRVQRTLTKAAALGAPMAALLDNTQVGVIHLDRRGQIVATNDRARAILQQGDGLKERDGVPAACVAADRAGLAQLLAAALPTSSAPAVSGSMRLRRASALPPFVVHVKPVGVRQLNFGTPEVAAQMLLVEPGQGARIAPTVVAATLGLTPVESRIAAWVAEGKSVREIAGLLGHTERSVRWHLHQVYHKHGLSGQVDLVRLVLSVTVLA